MLRYSTLMFRFSQLMCSDILSWCSDFLSWCSDILSWCSDRIWLDTAPPAYQFYDRRELKRQRLKGGGGILGILTAVRLYMYNQILKFIRFSLKNLSIKVLKIWNAFKTPLSSTKRAPGRCMQAPKTGPFPPFPSKEGNKCEKSKASAWRKTWRIFQELGDFWNLKACRLRSAELFSIPRLSSMSRLQPRCRDSLMFTITFFLKLCSAQIHM